MKQEIKSLGTVTRRRVVSGWTKRTMHLPLFDSGRVSRGGNPLSPFSWPQWHPSLGMAWNLTQRKIGHLKGGFNSKGLISFSCQYSQSLFMKTHPHTHIHTHSDHQRLIIIICTPIIRKIAAIEWSYPGTYPVWQFPIIGHQSSTHLIL